MDYVIAYDLGTGGLKASLHEATGKIVRSAFAPYETLYISSSCHEQRPDDWWNAVCAGTKKLLAQNDVSAQSVRAVALSGHSLVGVPIDRGGNALAKTVPIWSDTRAKNEAEKLFRDISYDSWYETTGNGDPPACYPISKLQWMKNNCPDTYDKTAIFLGSKDYVNFKLTGVASTDPSYASGSGFFNLKKWRYEPEFIKAAELDAGRQPEIVPSDAPIGKVTREASLATGLAEGTLVAAGGVDNACMALGACGIGEGHAYTSLGSCCWIAVTSTMPIIDHALRPYIFAHLQKGYYTSGMSIFAGGSAHRWVRDQLFPDFAGESFDLLSALAQTSPAGSNGVMFNPSLSGGSSQEKSPNIRGALFGLSLSTTRADIIRATMEGIALNLRVLLDAFRKFVAISDDMLLVGGGAKSAFWRQIFADVFSVRIIKSNIDQEAASLGAAALALKCAGFWTDFSAVAPLHNIESIENPVPQNAAIYKRLLPIFEKSAADLANLGDQMARAYAIP
ncbi:MAG: pentose kinase [Oscillospiraceae bacterium]|nr:pentose kinase [Oscillospiraceae bacterium]